MQTVRTVSFPDQQLLDDLSPLPEGLRGVVWDLKADPDGGTLGEIDVHSVRPARRVGPDGQIRSDVVVEITQTFWPEAAPVREFRGGCTLLIDLRTKEVRYLVRKRVDHAGRMSKQADFTRGDAHVSGTDDFELFASLHGLA